jgi:fimbrial chaperone protein
MRALLSALALLALPVLSHAGAFSVTPVRIYMAPKDRAVAITLTNEADTAVVLQAEVFAWSQKADGADELEATEDLILSPPIIKLAPRARQVVRLAMLAPREASRQMTYRLIVREVPEASVSAGERVQVPIALVLSMPVFLTPPAAKRELACELARSGAAKTLEARCANQGSAYAQVREATLAQGDRALGRFEGGTYILPGAKKTVPLGEAQALPGAGEAELVVTFDDGRTQTFRVGLP